MFPFSISQFQFRDIFSSAVFRMKPAVPDLPGTSRTTNWWRKQNILQRADLTTSSMTRQILKKMQRSQQHPPPAALYYHDSTYFQCGWPRREWSL